jgi:hypothetical protein
MSIGTFCENHPILCKMLGLGSVVAVTTGNSTEHPGVNNEPGVPAEIGYACNQMCDAAAQACLGKAAYSSTVGVFGPLSKGAIASFMWKTALGYYKAQKEQCELGRAICQVKTCGSQQYVHLSQ